MSPEQQGSGPLGSRDRMTLVGPVATPVTSLPRTPDRDIFLTGDTEESPRTKEGRVAAATLEQEMGRRSVAAAIRPIKDRTIATSSSAAKPITQEMVAEACDTLVRERHPASPPVWPKGSEGRLGVIQIGREGPKFCRNLLSHDGRRRRRLDPSEAGPRGELSRSQHRLCSVQAQLTDRRNSYPCAPTSRRPRSRRVMRAVGQGTGQARKKILPT